MSRVELGCCDRRKLGRVGRGHFCRICRGRFCRGRQEVKAPGPFQSHPKLCDPSCRHRSSPGFATRWWEPGGRSDPRPSPTADDATCEQVLTEFGHCSVSVVGRSRPDWVPGVEVESGDELSVRFDSISGAREQPRAREGTGRCEEVPEAGEDEVRCRAVADAVAVLSLSSILFVPD